MTPVFRCCAGTERRARRRRTMVARSSRRLVASGPIRVKAVLQGRACAGTRSAVDLAVVGAGAAGLMAAIMAGRAARGAGRAFDDRRLDGARTIGAKILVAGAAAATSRTHAVDETRVRRLDAARDPQDPPPLRRRRHDPVLRASFSVPLKRESTGKLFPVTDRARTVLDALLRAAKEAGVEIVHPWRVEDIACADGGFVLRGPAGEIAARRVILATGGRSLPKSGSDGHGFELARRLGHTTTSHILPGWCRWSSRKTASSGASPA